MSNIDLITQCFNHVNTFKRHRALSCLKKTEGKNDEAMFHELKMYQYFDNLELGLRALNEYRKNINDWEEETNGN